MAARRPDTRGYVELDAAAGYSVLTSAAADGDIDALVRLRKEGFLWSQDACYAAAAWGQLPTLKWLRANGCPWSKQTWYAAYSNGYLHILEWLYEDAQAPLDGQDSIAAWITNNTCHAYYSAHKVNWAAKVYPDPHTKPAKSRACSEPSVKTQG